MECSQLVDQADYLTAVLEEKGLAPGESSNRLVNQVSRFLTEAEQIYLLLNCNQWLHKALCSVQPTRQSRLYVHVSSWLLRSLSLGLSPRDGHIQTQAKQ